MTARLRLLFPYALFFGVLVFFLSASIAYAQTPLVQCGTGTGLAALNCQLCDLVNLAMRVIQYIIATSTAVAALLFCYAGYLFFSSAGSEEKISHAKQIFQDVVLGYVVVLIAFLVVTTLLQTLAQGKLATPSWSQIDCVNNRYLGEAESQQQQQQNQNQNQTPNPVNPVVLAGDCANGTLPQPTGGTWSQQQMRVMSCIAQAESTCNATAQYNGPANSNATGLYQVIIGGFNDPGHNLNFPSCAAAAGVTGNLNCYQRWVDGGRVRTASQLDPCYQAAKNVQCNTDAANWLMQDACSRGNCYSPWETAPRCTS